MTKKLVIVESPAKAKTINKYLGKDFTVLASFGHVRDLPKKQGSIDVNNDFYANYQKIDKNKKHIDAILASAKKSETIYLATDPDREGEAIAWHIAELIKDANILNKTIYRVAFNEITDKAVQNAIQNPREINQNLVNAQQARLTLDYLIGFNVSPLLWKKIRRGLSAGRVQSPALRLICEREAEIKNFVPEDYFSIHLLSHKTESELKARLIEHNGKKIDIKTIKTLEKAEEIVSTLKTVQHAKVAEIIKKKKNKNPHPPFITSSLQIEASNKCGFNPDITMKIAQNLYEGIQLNNETVGLITYMRTDSVQLSDEAIQDIRTYIMQNLSVAYQCKKPNVYANKSKNAQEAHEAIRPSSVFRTPESIKEYLTNDQFKLYELIWQRALASQVMPAVFDGLAVNLQVANSIFRINASSIYFDGFLRIYNDEQEQDALIPQIEVGEELKIEKIDVIPHKTEAKPHFTEASLIKNLEELGIGRPSTYVPIITTLKKREYIVTHAKKLISTEIGEAVSAFLVSNLAQYIDLNFTARLEDMLDEIALGNVNKLDILTKFWNELSEITKSHKSDAGEILEELCPECNNKLMMRFGKYGKFTGCSTYPACKYMQKNTEPAETIEGKTCPLDSGQLIVRNGKYGKFISCKNYPECKHVENIEESSYVPIPCTTCESGKIILKHSRYGVFYSCNNYPECKTAFKYEPVVKSCTGCISLVLMIKDNEYICPECKIAIQI